MSSEGECCDKTHQEPDLVQLADKERMQRMGEILANMQETLLNHSSLFMGSGFDAWKLLSNDSNFPCRQRDIFPLPPVLEW